MGKSICQKSKIFLIFAEFLNQKSMIANNILIDKAKCTVCGSCTKVCGAKTLEIVDNVVIEANSMCILCGHCAAICPENAITANQDRNRAFTVNKYEENVSDIEKLLIGKRSVREFKSKDIERTTLEKLIRYAEKAPSSSNQRKREYFVITDKSKILELEKAVIGKFNSLRIILNPFILNIIRLFSKKLALSLSNVLDDIIQMNKDFETADYPIFRNSSCIILVAAPTSAVQSKDDCIIAQQYMMLYADSLGVGSCIIGYAQYAHKAVAKVLKIKKGYSVFAVSVFGYQKYAYKKEIQYSKPPQTTWI